SFGDVLGSAGLGGSEHLVVYEDAMNSGLGRSSRGQVILQHLGFSEPLVLNGGGGGRGAGGGGGSPHRSGPAACGVRGSSSRQFSGDRLQESPGRVRRSGRGAGRCSFPCRVGGPVERAGRQ